MEILSKSEIETEKIGERVSKNLVPGSVVALFGGLGAGKTAFVRGMAKGLGIPSRVTSPTFTIVNEYPGTVPLFHFDMYRVLSSDDLFEIGWGDYLERKGICAIEWSENIISDLPDDTIRIFIDKLSDTDRRIIIDGVELLENTGF